MVKRFVDRIGRWPAVAGWPGGDLYGIPTASPAQPPAHESGPGGCEIRFMKLHAEGRFDEMWEMLAEDAQRAWGGKQAFIHDMPRLGDDTELLDVQVLNVKVLESWTDREHERVYSNVAQMMLRYRVRPQLKAWTLE